MTKKLVIADLKFLKKDHANEIEMAKKGSLAYRWIEIIQLLYSKSVSTILTKTLDETHTARSLILKP